MDAPGKVPDSINCHSCGAILDLTGQNGFTHVECKHCGALSVVPLKFGDFLLLNPIGIGGMGTVYKAIDLPLNRYLALKILHKKLSTNPSFINSFIQEARAAASVNHPNVAQVYAFGEIENQYYLSMELCERGSLDDRATKLGRLPEAEALSIGRQVASALLCAWQRGLLHRDVKPGNILFNEDGIPKIVDFGLARGHGLDVEGEKEPAPDQQLWGTPYYVAPEKLRGRPEDLRSDIYSLGATLFHALTGRPPVDADTAGEAATKQTVPPAVSLRTQAPDLSERTIQIVARMLARDPTERYATYDELIQDLTEAQDELKGNKIVKTVAAPPKPRFLILPFVATLATLVVCMMAIWFVSEKRARNLQQPPASAGLANNTAQNPQGGDGDTRVINAVEPVVAPFWENYDFKDALAQYAACSQKVSTTAGHKLLDPRINRALRLLEFKQQLIADFSPHPYDGTDLQTRTGVPLPGKIVRATDKQFVCATSNGEIAFDWHDLSPAAIVKLADYDATATASTESPADHAMRLWRTAIFCKQYAQDSVGDNYAQQAVKLQPSLQGEVDSMFNSTPSSVVDE
jgi:serine/threonine protein kinase